MKSVCAMGAKKMRESDCATLGSFCRPCGTAIRRQQWLHAREMWGTPAARKGMPMATPVLSHHVSEQINAKESPDRQLHTLPAKPASVDKPQRLTSLDAYRGFIMLLMASAGFALPQVAKHFEGDWLWDILGFEFDHVDWTSRSLLKSFSLWDLIQPAFIFMVGVAMPYSFASRQAKGHGPWRNLGHVVWRSFLLVLLAVFLSSIHEPSTSWVFTNVLAQIGLGYGFVYVFLGRGVRVQLITVGVILVSYWLLFAAYPVPGPDFDYRSVGVTKSAQRFEGFFGHWNKNTNVAARFDQDFLNLFPREKPFVYNDGGYQTLNFVPSMATMLLGLMAGELLRSNRSSQAKLRWLLAGGAIGLMLGFALHLTVCPSIKRIWTPSWAIFSAGWTFYMLAAFYWIIDIKGYNRWAFPLVVVGMNSIAMYCMSQLMKPWIRDTLATHLGKEAFSGIYGPIWLYTATLAVLWLICLWLYRRKIFIRI
jgi:predicted acyltransferase